MIVGRGIVVVATLWVLLHPTPCSAAAARVKWWHSEVAVVGSKCLDETGN